jgi:outer membrane murein-binding lipoprotein Lpp
MIKMKKTIAIFLILLSTLISGCSNSNQIINNENIQLKSRVAQLEKDLDDKNNQIAELQNKDFYPLTINYIGNSTTKRFVEKQCDLLGLPVINSVKLNLIYENTVVAILDTANVANDIWFYVEIPVNDSPSNLKGWIKESDTVLYTQDKIKSIQSEVKVKQGEAVYEVSDFSNIKSTTPYKAEDYKRGRIEEKRESYVRLECPGGNTIWVKEASIIYPEVN